MTPVELAAMLIVGAAMIMLLQVLLVFWIVVVIGDEFKEHCEEDQ